MLHWDDLSVFYSLVYVSEPIVFFPFSSSSSSVVYVLRTCVLFKVFPYNIVRTKAVSLLPRRGKNSEQLTHKAATSDKKNVCVCSKNNAQTMRENLKFITVKQHVFFIFPLLMLCVPLNVAAPVCLCVVCTFFRLLTGIGCCCCCFFVAGLAFCCIVRF